jgi:hypothetical protein
MLKDMRAKLDIAGFTIQPADPQDIRTRVR